ncbi:AlpA family transcriptional regulator [Prochlorococcus sp. MIT 0604]|uniref:helix-turn-helix transcriptional regulator n=1 Tax=Prochlorococcus sp. MIT 0604 TaxID=1501268 RepID=UPI0009DD4FD6|nr:AlpA family phage regulatory protein [Prochlorococcus sp. MIT 0604]
MKDLRSPIPLDRYFLTISETCNVFSTSRSTLTRMEKNGLFPKRVKITPKKVGYKTYELRKHYQENY